MFISYFEFRKVLSELEKEYKDLQEDSSTQANKKFGAYGRQTLRRVDKEITGFLKAKYKK
jgi:hypothetical protein